MRVFPAVLLFASALALSACGGSGVAAGSGSASINGCKASRPLATSTVALPAPDPPAMEPSYGAVRGQNGALDAAMSAYDEARFEDAATQLDAVATGSTGQVRRVALRMLGRTQLALGNTAGATEALRRLVENEPPMVRLDPDVEPLALLEAFYSVRHDTDGSFAVRTDRDRTLAIADFTNGSITDHEQVDPLRLGFASLMIDRMRGSTDLELVERVRLQWLVDEQNLAATQEGGRQAGRLLGADQVVFGTYIKSGSNMLLTARVVDVETGRILMGERVEGKADDFDALVSCLSELVAEAVDARLPAAPVGQAAESLDAVIAYARGMSLEESGEYAAAAEQYQLAVQISPDYQAPQQRMTEGLEPFMATNL